MQANTGATRNVFDGLHLNRNQLRTWGEKILTKERLAELALLASTATVLGYVVWWASKAAENYTILGLG
jgi:hypothetical protein